MLKPEEPPLDEEVLLLWSRARASRDGDFDFDSFEGLWEATGLWRDPATALGGSAGPAHPER